MDSSAILDMIQDNLEQRGQQDDHNPSTDSLSFVNPRPSSVCPFSFAINLKHSPLVVFTVVGTVEKGDVASLYQELINLLLFGNENGIKYKLVFDLKKTNFLHLGGLCNLYNLLTFVDPDGRSVLLNYVAKVCFINPSSSIPEHKEVVSVVRLAFVGFMALREEDPRYHTVKIRFVSRNREVDKFMKDRPSTP